MCQGRPVSEAIRRAIVRMARAGSSYRTIAAVLAISTRTVGRILKGEKTS